MTIVRPFRVGDMDQILQIADISLQEEYDSEVFFTIYKSWNSSFLVASMDGDIVGFICGITGSGEGARILMLAVHPRFRRRGIGSALLQNFTNICGKKGTDRITLEVRPSNQLAIQFYKDHGFQPVGVIGGFYSNGEDGVKMIKRL